MLILVAIALVAIPAFGQDQPVYKQKIDVKLVLVDATVTDSHGDQILGLNKDDFTILENGEPQKIDSIDYFTNRRLLTTREDQAKFKVERVKQDRYFILFFDKLADSAAIPEMRSEMLRAKVSAAKFVEKDLLPEDRVAVVGFDARLKVYTDFTNDKEAILRGLDEAMTFGPGLVDAGHTEGPSILAGIEKTTLIKNTGRIYSAIQTLAKAVEPIEARKVLVLFSPGVEDPDRGDARFVRYDQVRYEPMVHALNEANVSVYPVNLLQRAFYAPSEDMLTRVAFETGGDYFRAVPTYDIPLRKIENENNGYYMLTYYSKKPAGEHGYQPIVVKLKNPQFRIKAREGYTY